MKLVSVLTAVTGCLGVAHFAGATYVTLPETAIADISAYASGMFTDLWVLVALVIGIPFAFYVIRKVIGLVRAR